MSPDILLKIKRWLIDDDLLDEVKIERFVDFFKYYNKNGWVYPGVLMRKLNISANEAYCILECLKNKGILQINYETYCHLCSKFDGNIYETFSQVPEIIECEVCGSQLKRITNTIVIYRVIYDGND